MFTGIVEEVGRIVGLNHRQGALQLTIAARQVLSDLSVNESIAVNGVCLTVLRVLDDGFEVEAVEETLRRTTLGSFRRGRKVNLERALKPTDRLGGHFVQGHVDGVGEVVGIRPQKGGRLLSVAFPEALLKYVIEKGSVAIDGVSLTVANLSERVATISLIPHTLEVTTLGSLSVGDTVNIEVDLIGKYIESLLTKSAPNEITEAWLQKLGY